MKPSNFTSFPYLSILKDSDSETIARNIMIILERTGDEFRPLSWEEYREERLKDRNFSNREKAIFEEVIPFCESANTAVLFCKHWASV